MNDLTQILEDYKEGCLTVEEANTELLNLYSVMPSFTIIRWHDNPREDVVCTNMDTAKKWCDTYNKLSGEDKCFIDDEICKPYNGA